ncbi:hypothetical protein Nepgr_002822 [Nepenthes gracilis]|uniref:Uncharacterized protein n=1 Tax=Nepenthes gracilis TaxID=150966 RepID=A0AAD3P9B0_NEPGR|nr:hypothetical protein Nepgr_002822 [Nepenthes gracilis]
MLGRIGFLHIAFGCRVGRVLLEFFSFAGFANLDALAVLRILVLHTLFPGWVCLAGQLVDWHHGLRNALSSTLMGCPVGLCSCFGSSSVMWSLSPTWLIGVPAHCISVAEWGVCCWSFSPTVFADARAISLPLPPFRSAIFKSLIGSSVSPPSTPLPASPRADASVGVLTYSIQLNEVLGSIGTNCCLIGLVSNPDDPHSGKLGTSANLAPTISSVPLAYPLLSSQNMQIDSATLSGSTITFVNKTVSILGDNGPILSIDPLACPQKSSRVEQYHISSQRAADVASVAP